MSATTTTEAEAPALLECNLKSKCPNKTDSCLATCWNGDCQGYMHKGCSDLLLNKFEVTEEDRPGTDELCSNADPIVFCKKTCYNKWLAAKKREAKAAVKADKAAAEPTKKKRIAWEQDGCLDTLMEWLTTEGNYADYCGSKIGKTKTQYHKELSLLLKKENPHSDRTDKDVENKITGLERQFCVATDWSNNTGAGLDQPGQVESGILSRCRLYRELEPIMGDRPNAKPLATNEDTDTDLDDVLASGGDLEDDEISAGADKEAIKSINNNPTDETPPKQAASSVSSVSTGRSASSTMKKRLTATSLPPKPASKKGKHYSADEILSTYLGVDDDMGEYRKREVVAREREADARWLEAEALSAKAKTETAILSIQAKATLLRERKSLLDEGISKEEVDLLLPLPINNNSNSNNAI